MLKEKLPIFLINTLLLHIPLLALTDGRNYGETNALAARGLEELFFQLCCCVRFWFWWEIGFGFIYYVLMYFEYNTVVVLCQFLGSGGKNVFGVLYVLSVQYSCAVVSVFLLWREIVLKLRTHFYKKSYWVTFYDSPANVCFL